MKTFLKVLGLVANLCTLVALLTGSADSTAVVFVGDDTPAKKK